MYKDSKASTNRQAFMSGLYTVGLDVGDRFSHFCELDCDGEIIALGRMRTTADAMGSHFRQRARLRVALEAGTHSGWLQRLLASLGHEVIVANARELRRVHQSDRKNDRDDAQLLARLARVDPQLMSPIRHRSAQAQTDLSLLRGRDALVRSRTMLINAARGLVKSVGGRLPACSAVAFVHRVVPAIPPALGAALKPLLEAIAAINLQIRFADQQIQHIAAHTYPQTKALQQIVGVGSLTALAFILTIDDHTRFARSRDLGPYLGLVPRQNSSGESTPQLGITKTGNTYLRRLLVNCAHYILGPFGPDTDLRRCGLRLGHRGGKNAKKRAVVAVARKLAVLLHRLWVTGEVYQPLRDSTAAVTTAA
jgi:transposase